MPESWPYETPHEPKDNSRYRRKLSRRLATAALVLPSAAWPAWAVGCDPDDKECQVDEYLTSVKDDPDQLRAFLSDLPKGGDIHNHLRGAVPTEKLIDYAIRDNICINDLTLQSRRPQPCKSPERPATDMNGDVNFRNRVLGAWSMEGFTNPDLQAGHDHFFATFGKFGAAADRHDGDSLAEVARITDRQNQVYLETLLGARSTDTKKLVNKVWGTQKPVTPNDFGTLLDKLTENGAMAAIANHAANDLAQVYTDARNELQCADRQNADPACGVDIRFDHQVGRNQPQAVVFAQLLLGFLLQGTQGWDRSVGVNLVQPEDGKISLRDYHLQMQMIRFLKGKFPGKHVTLHAGELVSGLEGVSYHDLTFHINDAVNTAGAERIGHGVDLRHEDEWRALTHVMRDQHTALEAPLTSNCQILKACAPGEEPDTHPLTAYRDANVPVALATDDAGVSRSDMTEDYQRGVTHFALDYYALKKLTRDSLEYGFMPGGSLWRNRDGFEFVQPCEGADPSQEHPGGTCGEYLDANVKASLQWTQEHRLHVFEEKYSNAAHRLADPAA